MKLVENEANKRIDGILGLKALLQLNEIINLRNLLIKK
jgi:hypothetical protein